MYRKSPLQLIVVLGLWACASSVRADLAEDQYAVAARHYSSARWNLAVDEFTTYLDEYSHHERADAVVFFLGESLVQLGRFDEAHERFQQYCQRVPDGKYARQALFRVGETAYLAGDLDSARPELKRFLKAHPGDDLNGYVFAYLGEIALALDEAAVARDTFSDGLKEFPEGPLANECRFGLARSLEVLGDADGAIRFYRFLGSPDQRSALSDDALLQLGILLYQQARFAEARESLEQHRERFPASELSAHAAYWLGMTELSAARYQEAARILSAAADRFGDHPLAAAINFAAGQAYRQADQRSSAAPFYQRVCDQWPDSDWADDSLQSLVAIAWHGGDAQRVIELAEQFSGTYEASPLRPLVTQTVARVHLKEARYQEAMELLESIARDDSALDPPADDADSGALDTEMPSATSKRLLAGVDSANTYYLALAYLGAKRHQDALTALDRIKTLSEPPELAQGVHVARASALVSLERYEEAVEPLRAALASQPGGPDAEKCKAQLAVTLARLGRWPEVERLFERMRIRHSDQTLYLSTVQYLAEAAYAKRRVGLAEQLFREMAKDEHPQDVIAQGLSGLAWLAWQRKEGAARSAATFEQLLHRFPDSPLAAEAAMMRGQALEKMDKPEAALSMYRLIVKRYGDSAHGSSAMLAAARIHDQLQQDRAAEPLLRQWLRQFPESSQRATALYQLAWVLVDLGREDEADEVFDRIHAEFRSSRYWADATYRLAERAARGKSHARADRLAGEIVERAGDSRMVSYALYLRGQLAATAERWEDVVQWMGRLLSEYPESSLRIPAEYWSAEARYRLKDYKQARALFDRLETQTAGRTDTWLAMIPLRRAQVRVHGGDWDEAYDIAREIAARFPTFRQQHEVDYLVGRYHASRADFDEARAAYERVVRSRTGSKTETAAMAQWMIGETYFMQEKYNKAIKAYHRVEGLYDYPRWQAAALLQAGKCHEMVGRWTEAIQLYSLILKDYSETIVAPQATNRLQVARQRADVVRAR